ncbi:hypothetical protein [Treponema sp.]|uniref:hypothetical protein n=1 Tax=Treponema sp. TaxID=166 RepID=UPI0025808B71|nr:hypothetical protein [Treponema sp.]MBE6354660.1 hypothetical protein [Treponema sp.]
MKKILRKIMAVASMAAVLGGFVSCGGGEDPDYVEPVDSIWEGATILEDLADIATSWDEKINIAKDVAGRLQVGSKVIFEIDINGEYAKFMVASGWADCNVEEYYNQKGTKLAVTENADNPGVYETVDGAAEKGIYYFTVTEDSLDILKNGFGIRGNFILKKIGITNLGDPVADPDDDIELTEPEAKNGYFTFWAQSSGAAEGSVMLVLNYESETLNKSVTLSNVDIEYIVNDGEAKHYTENITLPKNTYGTDYQAKVPLFADYKVTKNDAIYIKITANVDDENAVNIIQGNLIDTDSSVNYWKEMCIEGQQKQILTGITYAESSDPAEDPDPAVTEKTVGICTPYEITVNKEVEDASKVVLVLQADSPDTDEGLTINIKDFEFTVKVGDGDESVISKDSISLVPNIYGEKYDSGNAAKTDVKIELNLTGSLAADTKIVLQAKKATVSGAEPTAIIFAVQETATYSMIAADSEIYKTFFTEIQ